MGPKALHGLELKGMQYNPHRLRGLREKPPGKAALVADDDGRGMERGARDLSCPEGIPSQA